MHSTTPMMRTVACVAATVAWIACFRLLHEYGTWLPFVGAGVLLASFSLLAESEARALLRPTLPRAILGVAAGGLMLVVTYGGFALLRRLIPSIEVQTQTLYALLRAGDSSDLQRAALIVVVASTEEVIFRGTTLSRVPPNAPRRPLAGIRRSDLSRIAFFGGLYALGAAASGNLLLVAIALGCGLYWGWLRVASGSVFAPILAHVAWDLSILVFRPLL